MENVKMKFIEDYKLNLAEAQFIGYHHGVSGYSIESLVESMGLTYDEWVKLKDRLLITKLEKESIDHLFEKPKW